MWLQTQRKDGEVGLLLDEDNALGTTNDDDDKTSQTSTRSFDGSEDDSIDLENNSFGI